MKIIHITAGIQETCGVSQYVVNTARAQQADGHDVTIVTTMTCGCPVADLKVIKVADPVKSLERMTAVDRKVIVHLHMTWNVYVHHAAQWCWLHNIPYVFSPHGTLSRWAMHFKWWKKIPCWWLWQRRDLKNAVAFHVTSAAEELDIRRLHLKQPTVIAPLGVILKSNHQATFNQGSVSSVVGQSSFRDVVFVGRIHPVKNLMSLVQAWVLFRKSVGKGVEVSREKNTLYTFTHTISATRLIIAGSDDVGHQAELVSFAKSAGLAIVDFSRNLEFGKKQINGGGEVPVEIFQKRLADCNADVIFTGPVYSTAKDWMFAHAWVSVLPSYSENFGGVVIESLAQGTPVIASTGTPWGELEEWKCGRWIEPMPEKIADALKSILLLDDSERESLSLLARDLVHQKYSWKSSAQKVLKLYETVMGIA